MRQAKNIKSIFKKNVLFLLLITPFAASSQHTNDTTMTYVLKNKNLEIQIDLPSANYNFSRFDWTGKIVSVKYKDRLVSGVEKMSGDDENNSGRGFYNEFGIFTAIGYDEAKEGDWFHKIGVGLLKKDGKDYSFSTNYKIQPAQFIVSRESDKVKMTCKSQSVNGYSYILDKEIELLESGFRINYHLKNTGSKSIQTDEYTHNFLAFNQELIGHDYILKFSFLIKPELFDGTVNPEGKVEFGENKISFNGSPDEQFFFGNISGSQNVDAAWELINTKIKTGISETGSFKTSKINLWGWKHVISPELFFDINVEPGKEVAWSRTYHVFETD